jgi:hypothetical protein
MEVDWSSGNAWHRDGALSANTMSVGFGGKQSIPHPSTMTEAASDRAQHSRWATSRPSS